mmetsp:Transcript_43707/g.68428  ORF Transcript_43707/g.68428 Transcript_43707/m.68428 type:complete len:219 (+) Transcript_43707:737-1393(+)
MPFRQLSALSTMIGDRCRNFLSALLREKRGFMNRRLHRKQMELYPATSCTGRHKGSFTCLAYSIKITEVGVSGLEHQVTRSASLRLGTTQQLCSSPSGLLWPLSSCKLQGPFFRRPDLSCCPRPPRWSCTAQHSRPVWRHWPSKTLAFQTCRQTCGIPPVQGHLRHPSMPALVVLQQQPFLEPVQRTQTAAEPTSSAAERAYQDQGLRSSNGTQISSS